MVARIRGWFLVRRFNRWLKAHPDGGTFHIGAGRFAIDWSKVAIHKAQVVWEGEGRSTTIMNPPTMLDFGPE